MDVVGDLEGHGTWALEERDGGVVHVRFEWTVYANKGVIKALSPLLRPIFRWNHNYAITRAIAGLEPFAQAAERERRHVAASGRAESGGGTRRRPSRASGQ